jgi:hypothetical protein
MRNNALNRFGLLAVAALFAASPSLMASTINYTGALPDQNTLFEVKYTLTTTSTVTISTSGVPTGDFFPVLWLFNSTDTTQLDKNDPAVFLNALITEINQGPGTYDVILTTFDQHYCKGNTVCNGVVYGNTGWSYNGNFFGRSPNFNLTIASDAPLMDNAHFSNPNPTQAFPGTNAPEPGSVGLILAGGAIIGWLRFRRSRKFV